MENLFNIKCTVIQKNEKNRSLCCVGGGRAALRFLSSIAMLSVVIPHHHQFAWIIIKCHSKHKFIIQKENLIIKSIYSQCKISTAYICFRFAGDYKMVTAVLSGDKCLEMRIFAVSSVPVSIEKKLTRTICRLMNRHSSSYRRYVVFDITCISQIVFRLNLIYLADELPDKIKSLQRRLQNYQMSIQMLDASQSRFLDLYCATAGQAA